MEQAFRRVISGQRSGLLSSLLRAGLRALEPLYAVVVTGRNTSYATGMLKTCRADRPVISVGNITTGGTGKTPVVRWLCERLRESGLRPAVLMRGYKSRAGDRADEQVLLDHLLNPVGQTAPTVTVHAQPDRVSAAATVARDRPEVDVFILDDGFQHRRLHRDFDLVLIDTTNPFGYDHVLPRGLLREPLPGLRRADAFLLTRVDQALPGAIEEIEKTLREHAASVPVYRCRHVQEGVITRDSGAGDSIHPLARLNGTRVIAFCGIGNPESFERQLIDTGAVIVTSKRFGDHHVYRRNELEELRREAASQDVGALVTTEKDWVKILQLNSAVDGSPPIWRVRLDVSFEGADGQRLLEQVRNVVERAAANRHVRAGT
jgi:tetraacyldisaccharide 4'-kinase